MPLPANFQHSKQQTPRLLTATLTVAPCNHQLLLCLPHVWRSTTCICQVTRSFTNVAAASAAAAPTGFTPRAAHGAANITTSRMLLLLLTRHVAVCSDVAVRAAAAAVNVCYVTNMCPAAAGGAADTSLLLRQQRWQPRSKCISAAAA
jgi:hypothetical protein